MQSLISFRRWYAGRLTHTEQYLEPADVAGDHLHSMLNKWKGVGYWVECIEDSETDRTVFVLANSLGSAVTIGIERNV
jgi:hypothetical protein